MRLLLLAVAAGTAYYFYRQRQTMRALGSHTGSTTNASDAVDDIDLPPNPTAEQKLDAGVQETFPASDPVSVTQPSETAYEAAQRRKRSN